MRKAVLACLAARQQRTRSEQYLTSYTNGRYFTPGLARTLLGMPDDLPIDVLTELGRVTWAAIKLEDYAESMCSFIDPANPRTDRRQVGQKIKDAKKVLVGWPVSPTRDDATAWLERARAAIERRNAALHAVPLVWIGPGSETEPRRHLLGEMPRRNRPYVERPLTVESLAELRSVLEDAADGWRNLLIAVGTESRRGRSQDQ